MVMASLPFLPMQAGVILMQTLTDLAQQPGLASL